MEAERTTLMGQGRRSTRLALEVGRLQKSYLGREGANRVLCGLDLNVASVQTVSIVGASGTGKSTLLNILGGIDHADCGTVRVNGQEITRLSRAELARYRAESVAFIFQFHNLISGLTAFENVLAALQALHPTTCEDEARCREALASVGLKEKAEHFPAQLSDGEQRRVAVARALVKSSPSILADEPTGNLDPSAADGFMRLLTERVRQANASMVLVTHSRAATHYTDSAYEVKEGRLVRR